MNIASISEYCDSGLYRLAKGSSQETLSAYMLQAGSTQSYLLQILQTVVPPFQERSLVLLVFILFATGLETFITTSVLDWINHCLHLARQYGQQFVKSMVSEHTYNRYINWLDKDNGSTTSLHS